MQPSTLAKRLWLLLLIIFAAFYLWGLGSFPLVGPDEPRYAEVAREMMARNDLITPTLGGLPWFEKPPLLYWMMVASYRVLGVNEYAARLGPAICGVLTGVFVYWLGKSVAGSTALAVNVEDNSEIGNANSVVPNGFKWNSLGGWSALVWFSSLGAIALSRGASFDIVLTMTATGALACFFVRSARISAGGSPALQPVSPHVASHVVLLIAFFFFAGFSLLAKGLVGFVIIFGVIILYYVIRREFPDGTFLRSLLWGIPLALMVAGIWYGPIIYRHGWTFIDQFIIQHHFARFTTNKYHHPGPIYFYLPVLLGLALPWTVMLVIALFSSRRWSWRGNTAMDRVRVFALAWLIVPVVFFSFSGSKLVAYILPVLPACALVAGERIDCFIKAGRGDRVLRFTGATLIVLALTAGWYLRADFNVSLYRLGLVALPLLVCGLLALIMPRNREVMFALIAFAALTTSAAAIKFVAPSAARVASVRDLLATAAARGYTKTPVVQLHTIERTAEFYAANRITYESNGEPLKLEGAQQVMEVARQNGGAVLCFVPVEFESQLTNAKILQAEVISDNGRIALVLVRTR